MAPSQPGGSFLHPRSLQSPLWLPLTDGLGHFCAFLYCKYINDLSKNDQAVRLYETQGDYEAGNINKEGISI